MDKVRLGRALGYGARHAAKALVQAADAATSNSPSSPTRPVPPATTRTAPPTPARTQTPPVQASKAFVSPKEPKKSALHPLKRYSGTVLLQVVGTFFAVFAVLMAQNAWKLRAGIHHPWKSSDAQHLWLLTGLFCVFAWFAVSSFLRAKRIERS